MLVGCREAVEQTTDWILTTGRVSPGGGGWGVRCCIGGGGMSVASVTTAQQLLHGLRSWGESCGGWVGVQACGRARCQGGHLGEAVVRGRDGRRERLLAPQRRVAVRWPRTLLRWRNHRLNLRRKDTQYATQPQLHRVSSREQFGLNNKHLENTF